MTDSRFNFPGDATVPAGSAAGDSQLTEAELRELLGDISGENFSEYLDRKLLGLGGMGAVYAGTEPGLNRTVAVKVLRPQYRYSAERIEAFIREARLTAKIDHPNIIPVHRFGVFDDAGVYFTMRRIAGHTLNTIISHIRDDHEDYRRRYSLRRLIGIFLSACNAVAFAHSRGVMHGDLKPGNIMVGKYAEVLVMDWGLAYDTSGEGDEALRKALVPEKKAKDAGDIGGTPAFMAPEHITGEFSVPDRKSEVYALGAILYSILTLQKSPFETSSRRNLARRIVSGKPVLPRRAAPKFWDTPRELEAICLKAMAVKREERYNDVEELIQDIMNYLDGYPVKAYSPLLIYRLQKRILRKPLIPALVFVLLLVSAFFYEWNMIALRRDRQIRYELAVSSANQGVNLSRILRRYCRTLRSEHIDTERRRSLEQRIAGVIIRTANVYESALGNLEELPLSEVMVDVKLIIYDLIMTGNVLNTHSLACEASTNFRYSGSILTADFLSTLGRHKALTDLMVKNNPYMSSMYGKLSGSNARLRLPESFAASGWKLDVLDSNFKAIPAPFVDGSEICLDAGRYILRFSHLKFGVFHTPLQLNTGNIYVCDLRFPEKPIPENMAYIPGSEDENFVRGFFIRRKEVTIAEYIEFWKSLPENERKSRQVRFFSHEKDRFLPLWDNGGSVTAPYRPDSPVFGVSLEQAEEYCQWLSAKLNKTVRLPETGEWERAAYSFGSKNISAYAVGDLNRSIRELRASKSSGLYGRNIGFRYVMDMEQK
ncbi:MAG: protein kinase [Lentisphaeria bacterium]|nr:protein kinase [Lentisphaeria bacterium]